MGKMWGKEAILTELIRQQKRPGQGPADGPHWIVMNLTREKNPRYYRASYPFRYPTEEAAREKAQELARQRGHEGCTFGVFYFTGITAKVEAPPAPVADETAPAEPEMQAA